MRCQAQPETDFAGPAAVQVQGSCLQHPGESLLHQVFMQCIDKKETGYRGEHTALMSL